MKKIATILGARPQFIKASVVSEAIVRCGGALNEVVMHTGQHFEPNTSDIFFSELRMPAPTYEFNIHGGGHGEMTGRMLIEIERALVFEVPNAVLVYGDTNSTLAGALAASKLGIPVAHVEAGLRSFNMTMPEEINRILTDRISRWLFTPTKAASEQLLREGIAKTQIVPVGDVMYDVALKYGSRLDLTKGIVGTLGLQPGQYVLATVHRAENTNSASRFETIVSALLKIAEHMTVVWPLHPRVRNLLVSQGRMALVSGNLHMIEPVGYLDMVQLEKHAAVIATDSGGVQKEAFFHRVPCVTIRDETEWVELVQAGWNRLAPPTSATAVVAAIKDAIGSRGADIEPYGSGDTADRIVNTLRNDLRA
ncbi:non-hydrolyzing UDP-N-acetylglucosamine 2-epimerase [Pseudorhodoplanes sp.]|uniref:non-hydrolyzing UDP-N-acetylglucosamine 2-epimerase n=1 Tax=Pseudorhodoplanes sp. TaxID=1934341 RepID=UPI003D0B7DFF